MVHQLNGKGSTWSGWVVGAPQAVGEVGRWLHPNPEVGGWVSRWLAEVLEEGRGGPKRSTKGTFDLSWCRPQVLLTVGVVVVA